MWRLNAVAAFCTCCGAEITLKAEVCPLCGSPQHGMSQPDLLLPFDEDVNPVQEGANINRELREPSSKRAS